MIIVTISVFTRASIAVTSVVFMAIAWTVIVVVFMVMMVVRIGVQQDQTCHAIQRPKITVPVMGLYRRCDHSTGSQHNRTHKQQLRFHFKASS
jgi:hypothetical protein